MVDNKILHCIVSHIYQHWSIIFTLSKILRNFDKFHYILKALYMISHKKLYCFWIENTLKLPDFKYYIFALIFLFKKKIFWRFISVVIKVLFVTTKIVIVKHKRTIKMTYRRFTSNLLLIFYSTTMQIIYSL